MKPEDHAYWEERRRREEAIERADAERQGAFQREEALDEAWAVARALLAEGVSGRLTPRRAARWRAQHAQLRETEESPPPLESKEG